MTDTTVTAAAPTATPTFFTTLSADFQWFEEDVIELIQNIGAGAEVLTTDITSALSWLGSHIGDIAATITAVQSSVASLSAAGVTIPTALTSGIAAINSAVTGVNEALSNQAVTAGAGSALSIGYQAVKTLQITAASAAQVAASIQATTAPTTVAPATASPAAAG